MPLSGAFIADFKSFTDACAKAEVSLKGFESGGAKVESQMNRVSDSFSGRKIIQDATLMAEVFERSGGAATFTTAELQRMGSIGEEAFEKLRKTGEAVPENLRAMVKATRDLGDAQASADPHVGKLSGSLAIFDGALAAVGVHIGPEVRGLGDLERASGKTAEQLGTIAVAGLAVSAAIGGWKIGRAVSDFFDLDAIIGRTTAKLLGFGDVGAQTAGANADKLAEASRRAGHEITDLGVATAILSAGLAENRTFTQQSADNLAVWHREIAKVRSTGELASLTKDLKDQIFSVETLSTRYHISVDALNAFKQETTNAANAEKAATAVIEKSNATRLQLLAHEVAANKEAAQLRAGSLLALTKLEEDYNVTRLKQSGTADEVEIAGIHARYAVLEASLIKAGTLTKEISAQMAANMAQDLAGVGSAWNTLSGQSQEALQDLADHALADYDHMIASGLSFSHEVLDTQLQKYRDLQDEARGYGKEAKAAQEVASAAAKKHTDELVKQQQVLDALAAENRAMGGSTTYDLSTAAGRAKVPADIALYLHEGYSFEQAARLAYAMKMGFDVSRDPLFASKGPRVSGFELGGPTTEGPAYLHDDEYVVPKGGALVHGGSSGGGIVIHMPITVQGTVVTERALTDQLSANITKKVLSTLQLRR